MDKQAFQDSMEDNYCFGCGTDNAHGLQIKSYWDGDEAVCTYRPEPHHAAGPRQFVNGGIIATVIDCHCIGAANMVAYRQEAREVGSDPIIWCVTGSLKVEYLRPTPIDKPMHLRARVDKSEGKRYWVSCTVTSDGKECARGEVLAIRVPTEWLEAQA